ncbi:MAG: NAD+ synthase [Planctomycetota bacterium]|nr:NAD+ synthase [Planctomycetota bacterium]
MNALTIDAPLVEQLLVGFIREEVKSAKLSRGVIGLSGGIDSAVSCALAAQALGPDQVLAVCMPYQTSSPSSLEDARIVAEATGVSFEVIDISRQIDAYFEDHAEANQLRRGNKMARERMTILYDRSAATEALVIGTSNKTELLLGYGTLFGDMASAINPLGDLYKTQVYMLGEHLGLPASVLEKAPTADLWEGQTDEEEMGFRYDAVDGLLHDLVELRLKEEELISAGHDPAFISTIKQMIATSQFKRRMPVIAKLTNRTINWDFRYPRDWGV